MYGRNEIASDTLQYLTRRTIYTDWNGTYASPALGADQTKNPHLEPDSKSFPAHSLSLASVVGMPLCMRAGVAAWTGKR